MWCIVHLDLSNRVSVIQGFSLKVSKLAYNVTVRIDHEDLFPFAPLSALAFPEVY